MRIRWICVLTALTSVLLLGCAHRVYTIGVDNPENPLDLPGGSKLCVKKIPGRAPFEHDVEIEAKLTRLLARRGYHPAPEGEADYLLLYEYRISDKMSHMALELLQGPRAGMHTVRRGGPFVHALEVRLVEAEPFLANRYNESLIWEGGAVVADVPTRSTRFQDLLVVAAVEGLGARNADGASTRMSLNDSQARGLRN